MEHNFCTDVKKTILIRESEVTEYVCVTLGIKYTPLDKISQNEWKLFWTKQVHSIIMVRALKEYYWQSDFKTMCENINGTTI